jgi:hypothetical protein
MKTKKEVLKDYSDYKILINAVISRIGMDSIEDINNHGINGGYSGFIYYSETHAFAMRYRKYIIQLLEEQAEDLEEDVVEMVSHFGTFYNYRDKKSTMDKEDKRDLYRYLGGGRCEQSTITNLMAWFAAEEVCRWFED